MRFTKNVYLVSQPQPEAQRRACYPSGEELGTARDIVLTKEVWERTQKY